VGTGQGLFFREYGGGIVATSHTEFTRLLAEHGLPGGVACLFVFYMAWKNFRQARTPRAKAFVSSAIAWTFIFMMSTGMRVVAPAFIFGLTFALFGLPVRPGRRPAAAPKPIPPPGLEALRPTTGAAPA
jgi:O-antigen ligase